MDDITKKWIEGLNKNSLIEQDDKKIITFADLKEKIKNGEFTITLKDLAKHKDWMGLYKYQQSIRKK